MSFALRFILKEMRSSEVITLIIALIISVGTVTSISLFVDRLQLSFEQESANLLAADRVVRSDEPFPENWQQHAQTLGLEHAQRTSFATMIFANDKLQLSQISAVTEAYPLRGEFLVDDQLFAQGGPAKQGPAEGEIWLSSRLASLLDVKIGQSVEVGDKVLQIARYLVIDPGSSTSAFAVSPRAVMNAADLAATHVIIPGSRVRYSLLLAGERNTLGQYESWIKPQLKDGQRWQTPKQKGQSIGQTINKAESFLLLSGTLAVVLSGVAMALASARFVKRHLMQVAVLKTLGATPRILSKLFSLQLFMLFLIGAGGGLISGWFIQAGIASLLSSLMTTALPEPSIGKLWLGIATGFISLLAFCLPLIIRLIQISPLSVLQPSARIEKNALAIYAIGFVGLYGLMCLYTQGFILPTIMTLAIAGVGLVVSVLGWVMFKLGRLATSGATSGWQIGLASLYRRLTPNLFQLLVFTLIIMLGLILVGIKTSLVSDWQAQLPEDAPNHYLFNVQANQVEGINSISQQLDLTSSSWFPMVRGRITQVNEDLVEDLYPEGTPEPELFEREMNLTWANEVGDGNQVVAGDFHAEGISLEQKTAEEAGITLGDKLTISIGGIHYTLPVTSIRSVDWSSMRPNFYVIVPKQTLADYPANFVSSFFVKADQAQDFYHAMSRYPTVSILNVGDLLKQIQNIIAQLSQAIQLVLLCILAAGALVLVASIGSTLEERREEGALLRVLGAKASLVRQALIVEFGFLGLFSGLIAALGAEASLYAVQTFVFKSAASWHPLLWGLGPVIGVVLITSIGVFASRTVLKVPPMHLLREF
ncbi:ABC transporter permease [Marinomonas pollencensis]|uniref:Putative ABC transport system permease protein n=1 Tax=Marinomonas pollencensis TaxID=491954 RepID=A0A3E0DU68_9GAMM|nr:FtsX-like permease family protein [Marinomonas pollencensis]REG85682.1 putative ABC transport system permease protein [Marinomonas pollencensis]